ncbi:MAG TPA: ATP-dependent DNA helicase [Candidatus Blautia excrementipullorum]|nr:ATP-dependent DNA helicase [Candidatus Blautia excrementipullorum]
MEKEVVRISVRNLVEFILRSGDLDSSGSGAADREAMLKGSRLHRKIQKQMKGGYHAEVPLKLDTEFEDLTIRVEGRADGILPEGDTACIDEIKGIYKDVNSLEEPAAVHRAQAMCYAWIYASQNGLSEIGVQMTYANLDTEEIRRFRETFFVDELGEWYRNLLNEYHRWVSWRRQWIRRRNASMEGLEFPFPYRKGQREMVSGVYHAISSRKQIFVQAPTGVGKTMSAVFPAVRALGQGRGDVIFYLTAKTITRTVAQDAFSILREKGLLFQSVVITAKEKLCFCETPECTPKTCPYAKGHFDRVNRAVYDLWTSGQAFDRDAILAQAEKFRVCPFEMCLDLAVWVDAVICDYNYAFDPNVHLKRFFGENVAGDYIFLIDEAHNLVERGREMYSAVLTRKEVLDARRFVKPYSAKLFRALGKVSRQLLELEKECEDFQVLESPGPLPLQLLTVQGEIDKLLEEPEFAEASEGILDFCFHVRDFLNISELLDENYVVYTAKGEKEGFSVRLYCVNPAQNLCHYLEKGRCAVFFSATLIPMVYYRNLLSTRTDDYGIYVRSPFDQKNRCLLSCMDVSSRYARRGYEEYRRMAEYLARMVWQKKGNYMAFFPSYKLLEDVYRIYEDEFSADWVRCICQTPDMNEREREEFLEEFREESGETLLGFCVMGGIFSEGIDLMGNRLIGAAIVGTGLPQVSPEREILRQFYDQKGENGFDYAYRYPGMNKVLQAAGRVIRTKEDTGTILLMDDRFWNADYKVLLPEEWNDLVPCRLNNVEEILRRFWESV